MINQRADEICRRYQAYRNAMEKRALWDEELQAIGATDPESEYHHAWEKQISWDNEVPRLRSELIDAINGLIQHSNSKPGLGTAWEIIQLMHRITLKTEEQPC